MYDINLCLWLELLVQPQTKAGGPSNVTPPEIGLARILEAFNHGMEQIVNQVERAINRIERRSRNETPTRQTGDQLLEKFLAIKPETFDGTVGARGVKQWIHQLDSIFETMECNDVEKKRLAVFQLTYSTTNWCEAIKATVGEEVARAMSWPTFKARFLEKHFRQSKKKDNREKEFIKLVQGNMTIRKYTLRFERLSRFAPHMADRLEKRIRKYQQGLNLTLHSLIMGCLKQPFETLVDLTTRDQKSVV